MGILHSYCKSLSLVSLEMVIFFSKCCSAKVRTYCLIYSELIL